MTLTCSGLRCGYHGRAVLDSVDLELRAGEAVALIGPNGSGKSTLMKTLSGALPPISGTVLVQGDSVFGLDATEIARRIAVVPQEETHSFPFTVEEVVRMGRLARSPGFFDTQEDVVAAESAMAAADCVDLRGRPITELSGGERQRALVARALAQQAPILLLDEPTSHLDVSHQLQMAELVRRLATSAHTIVAALHDLQLAALMADRGILLNNGKVVLEGPIEAVLMDRALDDTYGVEFERARDAQGRLRVLALASSCS